MDSPPDRSSPLPLAAPAPPPAADLTLAPATSGNAPSALPDVPTIDFGAATRALLRWWWVPVLAIALGTGGAWHYLGSTTPLYTAAARLKVQQENPALIPGPGARTEDLKSLDVLKSLESEAAGQSVLLEIADRFGLRRDPHLAGPRAAQGLNDDEIVSALAKRITATLERGTRHIAISVDDTDPARAKAIADAVVELAMARSSGMTAEREAVTALSKEAERSRARMEEDLAAVQAFRTSHPGIPLGERPSDMKTNEIEDRVKALTTELVQARAEAAALDALADQIDAAGDRTASLLKVPGLGSQETVVAQRKLLHDAEAKFAMVAEEYGPRHPTYVAAMAELRELNDGLRGTLMAAANAERSRRARAEVNVSRIEKELAAARSQWQGFEKISGEFQALAADLRSSREVHETVLTRLKEAEANAAFGGHALEVVSRPLAPSRPSKPRRLLTMAVGAFLGGMAGCAVIAVLALTDRRLRSTEAVERLLRIPALGVLPVESFRTPADMLVYGREDGAVPAEAIRALRTSLGIMSRGGPPRSVLFTSPGEGEGTTYTALNFAASLAQQGYRTLLIDAQLRRPLLDTILFGARQEQGLADHLLGLTEKDARVCRPTAVANLFLFAAGTLRAHPGEVLNEQAFACLLRDSLKWFHKVVIDTAAVGVHPDALPLARHADAVCLVVSARTTDRRDALRAAERLRAAGAPPVGFVLTSAPAAALSTGLAGEFAASFTPTPAVPALPPASA